MYPTLLKRESPFLTSMQTPIVKVFLTGKKDLLFYNEELYKEYEKKHKNVKNKYYKGLGSSSQKDIRLSIMIAVVLLGSGNFMTLELSQEFLNACHHFLVILCTVSHWKFFIPYLHQISM